MDPSYPPSSSHSNHSSTTSLAYENRRASGIRYPTVTVERRTESPSGGIIDRLREENARLRLRQEEITVDSNRRVDMHISEIRMLKEETKRLRNSMKELEGERNKARQLAHEWHKFARYSSDLVKQEVRGYETKLKEVQGRMRRIIEENEELKQLCLYLDEQRTNSRIRVSSHGCESDDQGCGSSEQSNDGEDDRREGYCIQKEDSLRRINMRKSHDDDTDGSASNDRILNYIHSLESRIKHLELATHPHSDSWRSSLTSETDDLTVMEKDWRELNESRERQRDEQMNMGTSTSTMTSSGTTFCSSDMDDMTSSAVFVDGTEPTYSHLEVRTLAPIEEEKKDDMSQCDSKRLSAEVAQSAILPPCIEPLSCTTLSMSRLRPLSSSIEFQPRISDYGLRIEETPVLRLANGREPQSVSEAVDALRLRETRLTTPIADTIYTRWTPSEPKYLTAL